MISKREYGPRRLNELITRRPKRTLGTNPTPGVPLICFQSFLLAVFFFSLFSARREQGDLPKIPIFKSLLNAFICRNLHDHINVDNEFRDG